MHPRRLAAAAATNGLSIKNLLNRLWCVGTPSQMLGWAGTCAWALPCRLRDGLGHARGHSLADAFAI